MENEQQGSGPGQPHDALFRLVFTDPEHAGSELRSILPAALTAGIDWDALTPVRGSFVSPALQHRHTDILFTTRFNGRDALLHVLVEHQRRSDRWMALRMLGYQVKIWEDYVRHHQDATALPMIIPVVLYQGRRRWTAATNIADLIDTDAEIAAAAGDLLARAGYLIDDLTLVDDQALLRRPLTPVARVAIVTLGVDPDDLDVTNRLLHFLSDWLDLVNRAGGPELFGGFLTYLRTVTSTSDERLYQFATALGPQAQEEAVTAAQTLRAEGRVEGRAELLTEMLSVKFGELDDDTRELVATAAPEQIATWSVRLVQGAPTLADVLA